MCQVIQAETCIEARIGDACSDVRSLAGRPRPRWFRKWLVIWTDSDKTRNQWDGEEWRSLTAKLTNNLCLFKVTNCTVALTRSRILESWGTPSNTGEGRNMCTPTSIKLAVTFLSPPASSVPCERLFSKAEILSKKRNCPSCYCGEIVVFK